jgi:glycosyltransferase involved in cell wall biosynthesis
LPVLESMSRGCPVIVDENTATREILAEGGIAIDMKSIKLISETLLTMTSEPNRTLELKEFALKRSFDFNREASVDRLLIVYT